MKYKVVISDCSFETISYEREILEPIGAKVELAQAFTDQERITACETADAILLEYGPINETVLRKLKNCKIIVRYGVGYNEVDIKVATELGIPVSNIPDYCTEEVAEHTLGLIVALERKIVTSHNLAINGLKDWTYRPFRKVNRLKGRTVGIIGTGKIGTCLAMKLQAMGMNILGYHPNGKGNAKIFKMVSLEKLLSSSDYVSIHCPLSQKTKKLITKKELQLLKKSAYFINTSRGEVVQQNDIFEALEKETLAGAALDVLIDEPPKNKTRKKLLSIKNLIITPHIGWYSEQAMIDRQKKGAIIVREIFEGKQPKTILNPEVFSNI